MWEDLYHIHETITGPWITTGDFNCVMKHEERIGSLVRAREIIYILKCMMKCGMSDLSSTGCLFTWNKKQHEEISEFSKLDNVMVNDAWC